MIERFMLNEELVERVSDITGVDYSGMLKVEDVTNLIKDLVCEYHKLEEEFEDYREMQNQEHFNPWDEFDVHERDFH